jgi:hypothetical protein
MAVARDFDGRCFFTALLKGDEMGEPVFRAGTLKEMGFGEWGTIRARKCDVRVVCCCDMLAFVC